MGRLSDNLSSMVFKSVVKGDIGEFSLDGRMLNVLMALDGEKGLGTVARALQMDPETLVPIIKRLYRGRLIQKIDKAIPAIDGDFIDALKMALSRAVGPIAEILIDDGIRELSPTPMAVPTDRAAELVELLARQIPREAKKIQFQKAMLEAIKHRGY